VLQGRRHATNSVALVPNLFCIDSPRAVAFIAAMSFINNFVVIIVVVVDVVVVVVAAAVEALSVMWSECPKTLIC